MTYSYSLWLLFVGTDSLNTGIKLSFIDIEQFYSSHSDNANETQRHMHVVEKKEN